MMETWLREILICPADHSDLREVDGRLCCSHEHSFPVIDDVPVMLLPGTETLWVAGASIKSALHLDPTGLYLDTIALSEKEIEEIRAASGNTGVDAVVQFLLAATCGRLYKPLVGTSTSYPIPNLRLQESFGKLLIDIGCSWGRWSIAASRKGYRVVGIDPSLGALMAARRTARQLGAQPSFVVADARSLPFRGGCADVTFSYSVLQHFEKKDARAAMCEFKRVLVPGGIALVQMPNKFGLRSIYHQVRRGFRSPSEFEVRYWTPSEMRRTFDAIIGPSTLTVDGFFGLGIQRSDLNLLPRAYRLVIVASEIVSRLVRRFPSLVSVADSLYVEARK